MLALSSLTPSSTPSETPVSLETSSAVKKASFTVKPDRPINEATELFWKALLDKDMAFLQTVLGNRAFTSAIDWTSSGICVENRGTCKSYSVTHIDDSLLNADFSEEQSIAFFRALDDESTGKANPLYSLAPKIMERSIQSKFFDRLKWICEWTTRHLDTLYKDSSAAGGAGTRSSITLEGPLFSTDSTASLEVHTPPPLLAHTLSVAKKAAIEGDLRAFTIMQEVFKDTSVLNGLWQLENPDNFIIQVLCGEALSVASYIWDQGCRYSACGVLLSTSTSRPHEQLRTLSEASVYKMLIDYIENLHTTLAQKVQLTVALNKALQLGLDLFRSTKASDKDAISSSLMDILHIELAKPIDFSNVYAPEQGLFKHRNLVLILAILVEQEVRLPDSFIALLEARCHAIEICSAAGTYFKEIQESTLQETTALLKKLPPKS